MCLLSLLCFLNLFGLQGKRVRLDVQFRMNGKAFDSGCSVFGTQEDS